MSNGKGKKKRGMPLYKPRIKKKMPLYKPKIKQKPIYRPSNKGAKV